MVADGRYGLVDLSCRKNLVNLGGITPYTRRIVGTIGERSIIQCDVEIIVFDILLDTLSQRYGVPGAAVDNAGYLLLRDRCAYLPCKFVDIDEVVLIFTRREGEGRLAIMCGLQQFGEDRAAA